MLFPRPSRRSTASRAPRRSAQVLGDSRYPLVPEIDTSEEIGDSAVNVIWLERELAPGETRVLTTYYGLGYIDVSEGSELKLGATKIDGSFTISEDGNSYNPVRLTSYVSNP